MGSSRSRPEVWFDKRRLKKTAGVTPDKFVSLSGFLFNRDQLEGELELCTGKYVDLTQGNVCRVTEVVRSGNKYTALGEFFGSNLTGDSTDSPVDTCELFSLTYNEKHNTTEDLEYGKSLYVKYKDFPKVLYIHNNLWDAVTSSRLLSDIFYLSMGSNFCA